MHMRKKAFYEPPVSQGIWVQVEGVVCSSTKTYTGDVNGFSNITEVDITGLWDSIL